MPGPVCKNADRPEAKRDMTSVWALPGPSAFLDRIRDSVTEGRSVVLGLPAHTPSGIESAVRKVIPDAWLWTHIKADPARIPAEQLAAACAIDLRCLPSDAPRELLKFDGFLGRVIWVEGVEGGLVSQWCDFLGSYEASCRNVGAASRSPIIVSLTQDDACKVPSNEIALSGFRWIDVLGYVDALLYASINLSKTSHSPTRQYLMASVVARVSLWDIEVADRLLKSRPEDMLAPYAVLDEIGRDRGWISDTEILWEKGTLGSVDGVSRPHSAICMLSGNQAEVDRRVWVGQASVLLPLIEERRLELLAHVRPFLSLPVQTEFGVISDPRDLEIGQLAHQVRRSGAEAKLKAKVERLRLARNKLAHMEPLETAAALHEVIHTPIE